MSGRFFSRSAAEEWGGVPTTLLQECNTLRGMDIGLLACYLLTLCLVLAMVTRQSAVIEQLKAEKAGPGDPYSSQREVPIPKPSTTGNLREAAKIDSQTTLTGLYVRLSPLSVDRRSHSMFYLGSPSRARHRVPAQQRGHVPRARPSETKCTIHCCTFLLLPSI